MPDQHTYLIELRGPVEVDELNARAPLKILLVQTDSATTLISASTDQAGFIGLLRHLHGLGFQFLTMTCEAQYREK